MITITKDVLRTLNAEAGKLDTDSGMVTDSLEAEYARAGIGMISTAQGVAALLAELDSPSGESQVILMRADPEPFVQGLGGSASRGS